MREITASIHIDAPPQRVWETITDFGNADKRIRGIVRLEVLAGVPIGKGTRYRETRMMFRKEATEEFEITEWAPPNRYVAVCDSCGCRCFATMTCAPDPQGNGTTLKISMRMEPSTAMFRIMSALMGWMMQGNCRKAFRQDLDDIRRSIEGAAPSSESVSNSA